MDRKIKNTLALVGILALILVLGFAFIFAFQKPKVKKKTKELNELKATEYNTALLNKQLEEKAIEAAVLDSILAARKFNIPKNILPLRFYEFMNSINPLLSANCYVNIEFIERKKQKNFFYYEYKISGVGEYNDVYQIIYAIEQSKELKKILAINLSNFIKGDQQEAAQYFVGFNCTVGVFFADNDRFASTEYIENNLRAKQLYDVFYPQLQLLIPPNIDALLDVQGARLLAIVPEGAFLSDIKGESFLMNEGDKVYLGYLTQIDKKNNRVKFILNKGGIVESVEIPLEREIQKVFK